MKKRAVSPVNGQPVPQGPKITPENAAEYARRSHAARAEKKREAAERASIAKAFLARMSEMFTSKDGKQMTGAEIIADSIIKGANHGNAKMVEIALALMGEKPAEKIDATLMDADFILRIISADGTGDEGGGDA